MDSIEPNVWSAGGWPGASGDRDTTPGASESRVSLLDASTDRGKGPGTSGGHKCSPAASKACSSKPGTVDGWGNGRGASSSCTCERDTSGCRGKVPGMLGCTGCGSDACGGRCSGPAASAGSLRNDSEPSISAGSIGWPDSSRGHADGHKSSEGRVRGPGTSATGVSGRAKLGASGNRGLAPGTSLGSAGGPGGASSGGCGTCALPRPNEQAAAPRERGDCATSASRLGVAAASTASAPW